MIFAQWSTIISECLLANSFGHGRICLRESFTLHWARTDLTCQLHLHQVTLFYTCEVPQGTKLLLDAFFILYINGSTIFITETAPITSFHNVGTYCVLFYLHALFSLYMADQAYFCPGSWLARLYWRVDNKSMMFFPTLFGQRGHRCSRLKYN